MRKYLQLIFLLLNLSLTNSVCAQDMFDESLETIEKFNNLFVDEVGSFLDDPYNHQNSLRVFEKVKEFNEIYKDLQSKKYEVLSKWDNYKTRKYYDSIDKMQAIAEAFEELLRPIAGYAGRGIDGPEMEILLEPLFESMGWKKRMINVVCDDVYFCEYERGDFKMMFVKNTRSKSDYSRGINNTIIVDFTYENACGAGGAYYVAGGVYRMIQLKDSENIIYRKLLKANSKKSE